jgi:hypothetical protein
VTSSGADEHLDGSGKPWPIDSSESHTTSESLHVVLFAQ